MSSENAKKPSRSAECAGNGGEGRVRIPDYTRGRLRARHQRRDGRPQVIWLGLMALPPGARTKAHVHANHETALYMMSGDVLELWTGKELEHCDSVRPGDYVYIPANVPHVAVNRGTAPAVFMGSRNEATAQESLVLHPELDARVP